MKVLFVTGEDFSALEFENQYSGTAVSEIIDNLCDYENEDEWELKVLEFEGDIDPNFIAFIRNNIQDYDMSKSTNFYLEGTIIGDK